MKFVCCSIHQKWPGCLTLPTNFQGGQPYIHTVPVWGTFFNVVPSTILLSDDGHVMWCVFHSSTSNIRYSTNQTLQTLVPIILMSPFCLLNPRIQGCPPSPSHRPCCTLALVPLLTTPQELRMPHCIFLAGEVHLESVDAGGSRSSGPAHASP